MERESPVSHGYTHYPTLLQGLGDGQRSEVGEEAGGEGGDSSDLKQRTAWQRMMALTHTHTFTFATVPQFWYPATPPPAGKESSHFTVYITSIDQ